MHLMHHRAAGTRGGTMANINIEIIHIAVKQIVNWKCAPPAYPSRRLVSARTRP
jgi:hypothetical protein